MDEYEYDDLEVCEKCGAPLVAGGQGRTARDVDDSAGLFGLVILGGTFLVALVVVIKVVHWVHQ